VDQAVEADVKPTVGVVGEHRQGQASKPENRRKVKELGQRFMKKR
jgi:hypothetical protein